MTAPKNPKPLGLPITLTAEQVLRNEEIAMQLDQQRNLRRRGINTSLLQVAEVSPFALASHAADPPATATTPTTPTTPPGATRAEREALAVKTSYRVGDTTPSKVDLRLGDIPGPLLLEVQSIEAWEGNPRLFKNEKYDDIKAAIQAQGFHDALVVTRRREGDRYLLAAGSNTTLKVLQELFAATGDERYRWVSCVFQAYESDVRLLAQHLGENLNRGDMKFWEIASGMMKLIELMEADRRKADPGAKPMSQREMTEALASRGLRADKTSVARWQFAVERLHALGAATALLTRKCCEILQLRLLACRDAGRQVRHRREPDLLGRSGGSGARASTAQRSISTWTTARISTATPSATRSRPHWPSMPTSRWRRSGRCSACSSSPPTSRWLTCGCLRRT